MKNTLYTGYRLITDQEGFEDWHQEHYFHQKNENLGEIIIELYRDGSGYLRLVNNGGISWDIVYEAINYYRETIIPFQLQDGFLTRYRERIAIKEVNEE